MQGWMPRERVRITQEFGGDDRLMDIAFCNDELYGIMRYGDRLVKFDIRMDIQGAPVRIDVHRLNMENCRSYTVTEACPSTLLS
ncbi:hypothetical protein D1007_28786 [Hordeum vulgare]|nr:hypothetical protein D1007_28786 [Hordeum vulgare]